MHRLSSLFIVPYWVGFVGFYQQVEHFVAPFVFLVGFTQLGKLDNDRIFKAVQFNHSVQKVISHFFISFPLCDYIITQVRHNVKHFLIKKCGEFFHRQSLLILILYKFTILYSIEFSAIPSNISVKFVIKEICNLYNDIIFIPL